MSVAENTALHPLFKPKSPPFRLTRYYALTSLICTLVIASALGWIYQRFALESLIHQAEEGNAALGRVFANSLWPRFADLVVDSPRLSKGQLQARATDAHLRDAVVQVMQQTKVIKVKVYNLEGITVFSSEAAQIGEQKKNNLGFGHALAGNVKSDLTHRDTMDAFEGSMQDLDVLATYQPITTADGRIAAIFEVYTDVTHLVAHSTRTQVYIIAAVVLLLGLLYVLLHLLVARAQEIINRQSGELTKALEQLGHANHLLDQRIQERTAALSATNEALRKEVEERRNIEDQLRLAAGVFANSIEGIVITDADEQIVAVNRAFSNVTGYSEAEVIGRTPRVLHSGRQDPAFYHRLWASLKERGQWQGEIWNRRKNGDIYPEWLSISAVKDSFNHVSHYVAVFSDITAIKDSQEQLDYLAHHDPLTGLANRRMFNQRVEQVIARAARSTERFALLFVDLDHFKHVNDSLGHDVGDEFLQSVARRLQGQLRSTDILARLGGDEFIILVENIESEHDAALVAQKVIDTLAHPVMVDQHELYVTASVGIALFPNDGDDVQALVKHADTAMYQAKAHGRNAFHFYAPEMTLYAQERLQLEAQMRRSIDNGEMSVFYQPQIDAKTGSIVGVEALVRWMHPERGFITPLKFIPIAEETGFICELGNWVMREACAQLVCWQAAGVNIPRLGINVSVRQFERPDFVRQVDEILREAGVEPARIELEITESVLMQTDNAYQILEELRGLGVCLAVDDFGTGYSSLSYLKRLPIQKLKIDRSFIMDLATDANDAAIVRAIIALARTMELDTVAEGVENHAQAEFLVKEGCTTIQGFLYGCPMSAKGFSAWVRGDSSALMAGSNADQRPELAC